MRFTHFHVGIKSLFILVGVLAIGGLFFYLIKNNMEKWETYTDIEHGFTLKYPSHTCSLVEVNRDNIYGQVLRMTSKDGDKSYPNGVILAVVVESTIATMHDRSTKPTEYPGEDFMLGTIKATAITKTNSEGVKNRQIYITHGDLIYTISYSANVSGGDAIFSELEQIAKTFKFLDDNKTTIIYKLEGKEVSKEEFEAFKDNLMIEEQFIKEVIPAVDGSFEGTRKVYQARVETHLTETRRGFVNYEYVITSVGSKTEYDISKKEAFKEVYMIDNEKVTKVEFEKLKATLIFSEKPVQVLNYNSGDGSGNIQTFDGSRTKSYNRAHPPYSYSINSTTNSTTYNIYDNSIHDPCTQLGSGEPCLSE